MSEHVAGGEPTVETGRDEGRGWRVAATAVIMGAELMLSATPMLDQAGAPWKVGQPWFSRHAVLRFLPACLTGTSFSSPVVSGQHRIPSPTLREICQKQISGLIHWFSQIRVCYTTYLRTRTMTLSSSFKPVLLFLVIQLCVGGCGAWKSRSEAVVPVGGMPACLVRYQKIGRE